MSLRVSIGSDHRGIAQRQVVAETLRSSGIEVLDLGTHTTESCDYPDIAAAVARQVSEGQADRGVLICGTGIGVSIAANKINGIRAAVCHDSRTARLSRQHNDANILCLPGDSLDGSAIEELVQVWMTTAFEGGRHQRRIEKITALDLERC